MNKFEVKFSKTGLIVFCLIYFVFVALCVAMFIFDYNFNLSITFASFLFITGGMVILSTVLFKVKVEDGIFKVRTKLGKKYKFDISQIRKVVCAKHDRPRLGPQYTITIITEVNELELNMQMNGFDSMAGYLLSEYDSGNLNKSVVSKCCYKELLIFKEGRYVKNK